MGKIADALEKHRKERVFKTEPLPLNRPEKVKEKEPPREFPSRKVKYTGYSHKLVALSAPDSIDAENFKVLRAQILFPKSGEAPRSILVTSAFPGEGKTFVSANLAASIAQGLKEHVLLVDGDLRRPSLHEMFGYANLKGLHEYLAGKGRLADLLIHTKIDKLSLLTAGTSPPNPTELLASEAMKDFVDEAKGRYEDRFVVIDATPSQVTAEANVLANYVDGIVFVVMAQKSPRETIRRSIENLGPKRVLGIVFNGYQQSYKSYHKYYKKYYK